MKPTSLNIERSDIYARKKSRAVDCGTYIAFLRGSRCRSEEAFWWEISAAMQFPSYFGENWAALDDCLCDLDWLHFSKLIISIDDYRLLFDGNVEMQAQWGGNG